MNQNRVLFFSICLFCIFLLFSETLVATTGSGEIENKEVKEKIDKVSWAIARGGLSQEKLALAYQYRGGLYSDIYWLGEAKHDLEISIDLLPENSQAYVDLGAVYSKMGNYEDEINAYEKAISLDGKNVNAYRNKGYFLFHAGRYKEASDIFGLCIELEPEDYYHMIWEYLSNERSNNDGKAILEKRSANVDLAIWPGNLLKLFLGKIKSEDVFINQEFEEAMNDEMVNCEAFFYLGHYFLLKGDKGQAEQYFQKTIDTQVKEFLEYDYAKQAMEHLLK